MRCWGWSLRVSLLRGVPEVGTLGVMDAHIFWNKSMRLSYLLDVGFFCIHLQCVCLLLAIVPLTSQMVVSYGVCSHDPHLAIAPHPSVLFPVLPLSSSIPLAVSIPAARVARAASAAATAMATAAPAPAAPAPAPAAAARSAVAVPGPVRRIAAEVPVFVPRMVVMELMPEQIEQRCVSCIWRRRVLPLLQHISASSDYCGDVTVDPCVLHRLEAPSSLFHICELHVPSLAVRRDSSGMGVIVVHTHHSSEAGTQLLHTCRGRRFGHEENAHSVCPQVLSPELCRAGQDKPVSDDI